jgi:hypothetical protein
MTGCAEVGPTHLGYNRIWAAELAAPVVAVIKIPTLRKHGYFNNRNTNSKQLYYKLVCKSLILKFLTKKFICKS